MHFEGADELISPTKAVDYDGKIRVVPNADVGLEDMPFETQCSPGLVENGPHQLRAEAEDSLGFVGTAELSFDLAVPLGIRRELALPATPSGAPVAANGGSRHRLIGLPGVSFRAHRAKDSG